MTTQINIATLFPELSESELERYLEGIGKYEPRLRGSLETSGKMIQLDAFQIPDAKEEQFPFQHILEAMAASICRAIEEDCSDSVLRISKEAIQRTQYDITATAVNDLLVRPLCHHMNDLSSQGKLLGKDPHERYQCFEAIVARDPDSFIKKYGQAWRFVVMRVNAGKKFLTELAERVTDDWGLLRSCFGLNSEDFISSLTTGGDSHNGGRRVTEMCTNLGTIIVYKPRSVDGEAAFSRLAPRLNAMGIACSSAAVVRMPGYGYMEFVSPISQTASDQKLVAAQTGELAAILYALNCRDMHFENIVLTHRGPIPVDLEGSLHPHRLGSMTSSLLPNDAHNLLESSVYGVGVLPLIITKNLQHGETAYYDVGFLGRGRVVGGGPFKRYRLLEPFTDQMRCVFDRGDGSVVEPNVAGVSAAEAHKLADAFVSSFRKTYRKLVENRDTFREMVAEEFNDLRLRYLHNPTILYTQVLHTLTSVLRR